jgi:hypothetical protein
MKLKAAKAAEVIAIASVIIIVAWLLILRSPHVSNRMKALITGAVVVSPVPPVP